MKSPSENASGKDGEATAEPIAIVGFGGVFPGAQDLDGFWNIIRHGIDTSRPVPPGRWIVDPRRIQDPTPGAPDRVYTDRGCFVEAGPPDLAGLDLPPGLVENLDPSVQLLLEAGRQALAGLKIEALDRSRTGIILGNIALPTSASSALAAQILEPLFRQDMDGIRAAVELPGTRGLNRYVSGLPAGILARALGLKGGSYTLDAACASSLFALKLAGDELKAGRAEAMLAGGLSRPDSLYTQMGFCQLRALSRSGRCAPFDAAGSGLIVGEGAGVVVLKRLSTALRDGDQIHALIRGIGLSNDLEGNLLSPASEGQGRALRQACREAGWSPSQVDLIECHATGTPVGDAVEFESLLALWKDCQWRPGQCALGAVKSNIGHLLTGAGSAGLIKILLALRHQCLPPVANFHHPSEKIPLHGSPFRILQAAEPWPARGAGIPRRAAINGFGFGGINAHVLLEEWVGQAQIPEPKRAPKTAPPPPCPVAIIGLGACVGRWPDLRSFQERVLGGGQEQPPAPRETWRGMPMTQLQSSLGLDTLFPGYYLDDISIPVSRYRIPPKELGDLLPQQILMLEASRAALDDAQARPANPARTGVFVGLGLDLRTTDFHFRWTHLNQASQAAPSASGQPGADWLEACGPALTADRTMGALAGVNASRIAKEFRFGGPSHTVCGEDASGLRALEIAVRALQRRELDQALAGAVDVTGDLRALLATDAVKPFSRQGAARPFDSEADGPVPGEGAVSVVLKRLDDALRDGDRIYAVVRGIGSAGGGGIGAEGATESGCQQALARAYEDAGIDPQTIGYIEAGSSGTPEADRREVKALTGFFGSSERRHPIWLGSAQADVGHAGAASGLVSVLKASLAIYQEIIPPLRGLRNPIAILAENNLLRAPAAAQHWVRDRADGPRRAGVNASSVDGTCLHVVLEACEAQASGRFASERSGAPGARPEGLFVLGGSQPADLRQQVDELRQLAARHRSEPVESLARLWWQKRGAGDSRPHCLAVAAQDAAQLGRLLQTPFAEPGHSSGPPAAGPDGDWSRDRDRVFYVRPEDRRQGKLAFVFPGSGSHFAEMGRDLAVHWPEILRRQDAENQLLASQMFASQFWNASAQSGQPLDHRTLICGQVALGTLVSDLAASFGLRPQAAIGYSLGEATALFALRAWRSRDEMLRRVGKSTLFTQDLTGHPDRLRQAWKLPPDAVVEWKTGLVDRSVAEVRAAMAGLQHLYVLIVNTPHECVMGGNAPEIKTLLDRLACQWFPLTGVSTVHCELLQPVAKAYRELHLFETTAPEGISFFSGSTGRAYVPDRDTAADAILAQASGGIDFPRVIEAAYDSGVRFFLEMGPGNSCSRMIGQILSDRPHLARSLCANAQDSVPGIFRVLAQLIAEGVAVDLGKIYGPETGCAAAAAPLVAAGEKRVRISLSGPPFGRAAMGATNIHRQPSSRPDSPTPSLVQAPAPEALGETARPAAAAPLPAADPFELEMAQAMAATQNRTRQAHEAYLAFSQSIFQNLSQSVREQMDLIAIMAGSGSSARPAGGPGPASQPQPQTPGRPVAINREACLEFARGSVAKVLGGEFQEADAFPTRVRLPDEPLMLVDRILEIHGEARSMTHGRVVTEHDILPGAWYLDGGCIPTCIAVEAGQADLFLSGYLGIDFQTRGLAVYRLLDARVCFHRSLPGPGSVIRYDIRIERFFRQGNTWLFRFSFESTVDGQPLLTMTNGCAGFFSASELAGGRGIVRTAMDLKPLPGKRPADWDELVATGVETYSAAQLEALRAGDLARGFGPAFAGLPVARPFTLPGGRMKLVHRVPQLDPGGGRFGLGLIRGEADINPGDWFLTCHFVDDRVMPGTLMFECCLHTLRIFLLRLGWIAEQGHVVLEPVPGVNSQLKCRGQVLETTATATYEISIKELGYEPAPYAIADALMYADGKPIVEITNLSLRYTGATRETFRRLWAGPRAAATRQVLYDRDRILAFAVGKPSEAFGAPYRVFDQERRIARLPGPPYQFLDRIIGAEGEPFKMAPGARATAEYDIPPDAWYFTENRQGDMPFAVLLEIALQPCGWLAAYAGSALTSETDLSFRNLGGKAVQLLPVFPGGGTLTTRVHLTRVSSSAGMIIQWYDFEVRAGRQIVYQGDTYFGFFPQSALARQEGLQNAALYKPGPEEAKRSQALPFPRQAPLAGDQLRMVDDLIAFVPDGGPQGLGFLKATKQVDPGEWFFKAHFYQDPVVPGSLGLESFLQLLKFAAIQRWGHSTATRWEAAATGDQHEWTYRGQVIPADHLITVEAVVTRVNDGQHWLSGDGFLSVDGRVIYAMKNFTVRQQAASAGGCPG